MQGGVGPDDLQVVLSHLNRFAILGSLLSVTSRALSYHSHAKLAPGLKVIQDACCFTPPAVLVKKRCRLILHLQGF